MTNLIIVTLSPNEYTLQNTSDLVVYYKGQPQPLPAGATLYFEDAGYYEINTAATEDYASAYFHLLIEATAPDDGEHPNRVIINKQAEIQALKESLARGIDAAAEGVRQQFITPGAGQAMTYMRKYAQAKAYLADNSIDPAQINMLTGEVGITAADIQGVAESVVAANDMFELVGGKIEKARLERKKEISEASTVEALTSLAPVNWSGLLA